MTRHAQLNNIDHADLKVVRGFSKALGDGVMFAPVFPHEFRDIQACYPIVFAKDAKWGRFRPLALFGLEDGENLFLSEGDRWDADYIPIAMRMRPFLIGVSGDASGGRNMEVHIDLDHPKVGGEGGERLFREQGGHAPLLQDISKLLGEVHDGEQLLPAFSALLDELNLLEPFTLDITLNNGERGRLTGYSIIAEDALFNLDKESLGRLQDAKFLPAVYMAVASFSQFRALINRRNQHSAKD